MLAALSLKHFDPSLHLLQFVTTYLYDKLLQFVTTNCCYFREVIAQWQSACFKCQKSLLQSLASPGRLEQNPFLEPKEAVADSIDNTEPSAKII